MGNGLPSAIFLCDFSTSRNRTTVVFEFVLQFFRDSAVVQAIFEFCAYAKLILYGRQYMQRDDEYGYDDDQQAKCMPAGPPLWI